jgi:hypothetical protein
MRNILLIAIFALLAACKNEDTTTVVYESVPPDAVAQVTVTVIPSNVTPNQGEEIQLTSIIEANNVACISNLQWVVLSGPSTNVTFETPNAKNTKAVIDDSGDFYITLQVEYFDLRGNIGQVNTTVKIKVKKSYDLPNRDYNV